MRHVLPGTELTMIQMIIRAGIPETLQTDFIPLSISETGRTVLHCSKNNGLWEKKFNARVIYEVSLDFLKQFFKKLPLWYYQTLDKPFIPVRRTLDKL